jgi:structural maintenance of chromosome 2
MFNNANVIFRTKFVDGVSTVTRTIGAGATRVMKNSNDVNMFNDNNNKRVQKSKTARTGKENAAS